MPIQFVRRFDGREDRDLLQKLTTETELSGLLNHAVSVLPDLLRSRQFTMSRSLVEAHKRFQAETDTVAGFIDERCQPHPTGKIKRSELFAIYEEWCRENNRGALGRQKFHARLTMRLPNLTTRKRHGDVHYVGIALGTPPNDPGSQQPELPY